MAFAVRNLHVLGYASGFTLWLHKAGDEALDAVAAPGYFSDAYDMLAEGDLVVVNSTGGAKILAVAEIVGGSVSTASLV